MTDFYLGLIILVGGILILRLVLINEKFKIVFVVLVGGYCIYLFHEEILQVIDYIRNISI